MATVIWGICWIVLINFTLQVATVLYQMIFVALSGSYGQHTQGVLLLLGCILLTPPCPTGHMALGMFPITVQPV
jgi:hypothetical protein